MKKTVESFVQRLIRRCLGLKRTFAAGVLGVFAFLAFAPHALAGFELPLSGKMEGGVFVGLPERFQKPSASAIIKIKGKVVYFVQISITPTSGIRHSEVIIVGVIDDIWKIRLYTELYDIAIKANLDKESESRSILHVLGRDDKRLFSFTFEAEDVELTWRK